MPVMCGWVRAPYEESVFLGGDSGFAEMQAVAAGPGGVLALGRIGTDDEAAAVWIGATSMITPNGPPAPATTEAPERTGG